MSAADRLHDPALARRAAPRSSPTRPGTTSATSSSSSTGPIPRRPSRCCPKGLDPHPDPGRCALVFADWQSCSDGGGELLDPSRSQYKECFVVVNALLDGEEVTTCPFIWVDRDFALTRGWLQGFPKKLGSIWITRTFGLDAPADPGIGRARRFGGTCAAYERRVAEATVTLERLSEAGPTHNDPPIVNVRHFARLEAGRHDDPAVHELGALAQPRPGGLARSGREARRSSLYGAEHEEHDLLAPVRVGKGFRFTFGYTVDDQEIVKDIRNPRAPTRVSRSPSSRAAAPGSARRSRAGSSADGYDVAVTGRRAGPVEEVAAEVDGLAVVADTGVAADAERAVAETVERFGGLDALVLNAGIGGVGSLLELEPEVFEDVLRVNVTGAFLTARAAIPHLLERRGAIVSIASVSALRAAPGEPRLLLLEGRARDAHAVHRARPRLRRRAGELPLPRLGADADGRLGDGRARPRFAREAPTPSRRRTFPCGARASRRRSLPPPRGSSRTDASYLNGAVIPVDGGATIVDVGSLAFGRPARDVSRSQVSRRRSRASTSRPTISSGASASRASETFIDLSPIDEQPLGEIARGGQRGGASWRWPPRQEAFPALGGARPGRPRRASAPPRRPDRRERRAARRRSSASTWRCCSAR